jgi:AcrR family transcriptional regulator
MDRRSEVSIIGIAGLEELEDMDSEALVGFLKLVGDDGNKLLAPCQTNWYTGQPMASAPAFRRLAPDARRRQILDVAGELFAARGYEAVSVEDIATAASVTRGLVHHYFGGKHEIYMLLLDEAGDEIVVALATTVGTPEERVDHTVRGWLDWVEANRTLWGATAGRFAEISDPDISAVVGARRVASLDRIVGNFRDLVEDGPKFRYALESWTGLNRVACRRWLEGHATREEAHELLTGTLLYVLRAYGEPDRGKG